jgi:peptidyl-prolyl cis-trans isomerase D
MLQRIGDTLKGNKWLTYLVFGALALIFAAWGAYGIANLRFGGAANAVKVNGHTIPYEQVRQAWQQQQAQWQQRFGADIPAAEKARLEDQLLESFERSTLITDHTRDLGYRVSDDQLREAVRSEPAFQLDGRYSPETAKLRLAQAGISLEAYEQDKRESLLRDQVQEGISISAFVTPRELARSDELRNEERQIHYLILPGEKFAGAAAIDDAAVQSYYDQHKAQFMTPESVHLQYAQLKLSDVAEQIQVPEADLRSYYDKNKERYIEPERRRARHILIQVKNSDDAAAFKKAQDVLAKAKSGSDFAALAKQYSDDPGTAAQGGDLDWSDRDALASVDKLFADAIFSMSANEIRGPVKTQSGYHIIRLDGIEPAKGKTFEEARADIESSIRHDRAADRFGDIQEQLQQKMEQQGTSLEALAKEFNMQSGEVAQFVRGSGGGDLGTSKELQDAVFSDAVLAEHGLGGPVVLGENRLIIVRALEHHMPAARPVADVRDTIVAAIRKERGMQGAMDAAQAGLKKLEAGSSLDDVARGLGVSAEPARFVGRVDPAVPAQIRETAFASPKPTAQHPVFRAFATATGAALVVVSDVRTGSAPKTPQQITADRRQQAAQTAFADADAYLEQLRATASVEKNPQVFDQ